MATTYLTRTPGSAGNRKTWTWSGWVKRALLSSGNQVLFEGITGGFPEKLQFTSSDRLEYDHDIAGTDYTIYSSAQHRDPSAWYHVVFAKDTTQATETNRIKVYVNGEQISMIEEGLGYPPEDYEGQINNNVPQYLGSNASSEYFNGSMANVEMVDGQQLTPAYFGSTDSNTGIWKPGGSSAISSYGTNGFKLKMDTATPGADTSGNTNNFTVGGGTPTLTQGSPSNVYANLNSLEDYYQATTLSNGNTTLVGGGSYAPNTGTIGLTKGKWYWETKVSDWQSSNGSAIGVSSESATASGYEFYNQSGTNQGYGYFSNGSVYGGATLATGYGTGSGTHYIGVAIDLDNNKIAWSYDGAWQGSANPSTGANMLTIAAPSTLATGTYFPAFTQKDETKTFNVNFGEGFFGTTAAGTQADDNGQGLFAYDVPAGYYAMNTKNLEAYG